MNELDLGAMAQPIQEQLKIKGLGVTGMEMATFERLLECIFSLYVFGIFTENESRKTKLKLLKLADIKPINKKGGDK